MVLVVLVVVLVVLVAGLCLCLSVSVSVSVCVHEVFFQGVVGQVRDLQEQLQDLFEACKRSCYRALVRFL